MICVRASPIYLLRGYVIATGLRVGCLQTLYSVLFKVRRARVIQIDCQHKGVVVRVVVEFTRSALVLALASRASSPMFSKRNEKKNKATSVYTG